MQFPLLLPLVLVSTGTAFSEAVEMRPVPALEGEATGAWDLPTGGASGLALGTFFDAGENPVLNFQAGLVAGPSLCSFCLTGLAAGTLDDGIGTGPDYLVEGVYYGVVVYGIGLGGFDLELHDPTGAAVGEMYGYFVDLAGVQDELLSLFYGDYELGP